MEPWMWALALLGGALGGIVDNVVGMGFGALSGTLMLGGGVPPVTVVTTVNLAKVGSGAASALSHWRLGNLRWRWVLPLAGAGVAGGIVGAFLLTNVPAPFVRLAIPAFLLATGVLVLARFAARRAALPSVAGGALELEARPLAAPRSRLSLVREPEARLAAIGWFGGLLNALSGAFGPFVTASVVLFDRAHPRYAVGTVNFAEFFVAGAIASALFLQAGPAGFRWELAVALLAGGVLGAPAGAYLCRRLPARWLGLALGVTLIALNGWSLARALA